jgi:hypothetical protein|nr:MAG TPA: hypothetical protein [Caudoviricetes sp.]
MRTINDVKLRIEKLSKKPVENFRLINKWKRILKKMKGENA